uniref:Uncharacterized protein n=1 Tax=Cucumis melo TaxID=3656 RepID=A0A9I9CYF0_CUCME
MGNGKWKMENGIYNKSKGNAVLIGEERRREENKKEIEVKEGYESGCKDGRGKRKEEGGVYRMTGTAGSVENTSKVNNDAWHSIVLKFHMD